MVGGTPGGGAVAPEPGLLEFALGADLLGVPAESLINAGTVSGIGPTKFLTFSYTRRTDAPDVTFGIEMSDDLRTWEAAQVQGIEEIDNGNGTMSIRVRSVFAMSSKTATYLRLKVARVE